MTTPPLDLSRPVQTRDGRPARIICTDQKGPQPIVALVTDIDGTEASRSYSPNGKYYEGCHDPHPADLINTPIKRIRWLNVYDETNRGFMYDSKEAADQRSGQARIACIRVEFVEGEGIA